MPHIFAFHFSLVLQSSFVLVLQHVSGYVNNIKFLFQTVKLYASPAAIFVAPLFLLLKQIKLEAKIINKRTEHMQHLQRFSLPCFSSLQEETVKLELLTAY
jgi:hypothetical protein